MNDVEQKTVEVMNRLDALATQYAPDVIDGALAAIQVTAIGNLIWGFFGLACVYVSWLIATSFTKYAIKKKNDEGYMSGWEIGVVMGMASGLCTSSIIAVMSIAKLVDIWNWAAIWSPKLALAHHVLGL